MKQTIFNLLDRFFKLGMLFLLSIFIGRFLGPESLGKYSLITSVILVFSTFITGGSDILIFRDFSLKNILTKSIIYSFYARIFFLVLSILFLLVFRRFYFQNITDEIFYIICGFLLLFLFNANEQYFISRGNTDFFFKLTVIICVPFFFIKIFFIHFYSEVIFKFYIDIVEQFFLVLVFIYFLCKFFVFKKENFSISKKFFYKWVLNFIPLWLNAIIVILYTKADQFILSEYLGMSELGKYMASIQISSIILIPVSALLSSKLGLLLNLKINNPTLFEDKVKQYTLFVFRIAILWCVFLYFFSGIILNLIFGDKFSGTSIYMVLYSFAMIFNCTGMVAGQWIIVEKLYWIPTFRSVIGLILNVFLNFILIPKCGVLGACYSAIFTSFITNFILYFFSSNGKTVFFLQLAALGQTFNLKKLL
ncbi:polysaccharide biosynthesis C-terminal domain-containing protein [Flavobacterium sp. HJJ]|uniref:oligosaccharide flippase family protein n=1 Tax=Flavobacterium sp. HJJ TaxID=2783792 RepID=UPI00188A952A|nr:polysaccharide biosynthesis C-terminal domain-containing protein [Flavobacterium sp. HJJ]MBF4470270.1 polysaccharide biosynthesis C-terminal domain-containing protein [Flavobacterium sp. HJJ]